MRRFGSLLKTYGRGVWPVPGRPPEPHESESQATSLPCSSAAARMRAKADGRLPATVTSWSLSRKSFTGAPALRASSAPTMPQRSGENFEPKPPPMYSVRIRTWLAGTPSSVANCPARVETAWVEA